MFSPVEWNQSYYESGIFTEREKQVYRNTHYRMSKSITVLLFVTFWISGAFCELFSQVFHFIPRVPSKLCTKLEYLILLFALVYMIFYVHITSFLLLKLYITCTCYVQYVSSWLICLKSNNLLDFLVITGILFVSLFLPFWAIEHLAYTSYPFYNNISLGFFYLQFSFPLCST